MRLLEASLRFRKFHSKRIDNLGQNPKALFSRGSKSRRSKIKMPSLNAPLSADLVSIFKLTIDIDE